MLISDKEFSMNIEKELLEKAFTTISDNLEYTKMVVVKSAAGMNKTLFG